MALFGPTPENIRSMYEEFGVDGASIRSLVAELSKWLSMQPHLPHLDDDRRLERVLVTSKFSLERAKRALDRYYTVRNYVPELFADRDPRSTRIQQVFDTMTFVPLPKLTPQGRRVSVLQLKPVPPGRLDVMQMCKVALMFSEVRIAEDTSLGDIVISDLQHVTLAHIAKFTIPVLRKLEVCLTSAFNVRLGALHYVNAPVYVDKLLAVFKTVLNPKVAARIHVHTREAGLESLYKHVPPTVLPLEYGGDAGPLQDMVAAWRSKLDSYRDWFLAQEALTADESRRPGQPVTSSDLFGFEGTFRKLAVD